VREQAGKKAGEYALRAHRTSKRKTLRTLQRVLRRGECSRHRVLDAPDQAKPRAAQQDLVLTREQAA
jgi:hypothetical protein